MFGAKLIGITYIVCCFYCANSSDNCVLIKSKGLDGTIKSKGLDRSLDSADHFLRTQK